MKFSLVLGGIRCQNIEDIQNYFNLLDVFEAFENNRLEKWLISRDHQKELKAIKDIDRSEDNFIIASTLCKIFGISMNDVEIREELEVLGYKKSNHPVTLDQHNTACSTSPKDMTLKALVINNLVKSTINQTIELIKENARIIPITLMIVECKDKKCEFDFIDPSNTKHILSINRSIRKSGGIENEDFFIKTSMFDGLSIKNKGLNEADVLCLVFLDVDNIITDNIVDGQFCKLESAS